MTPDSELLADFARTRSGERFAELVRRHVNLVYSASLRQVNGDAHLAEDVVQSVFTDLARKAEALARHENLSGWLYTSAHFAAAKVVRGEARRRQREETFMREATADTTPETDWKAIQPVLDEAMHELKDGDREALLLRYFENRPFAEVGARLGLNENAARMRVERALEKLRAAFARRGIAATATLAAVISANAVQMAPAQLAAALVSTSLATASTGTLTLLKIMTATQLKLGISAVAVAGLATALVVQHQTQTRLREQTDLLTQEVAQLKTGNENLSNRLAVAKPSATKPSAGGQSDELLRLRGEVGVLRHEKENLEKALAGAENSQPRRQNPANTQPPAPLPADYPKTPDLAAQRIFEAFGKGDWEAFFANFGQPGVPRTTYDQMFTDEMKSNLTGLQVISIGQPTNGFSEGHFFVPYKIQFQDGGTKEYRLSIKQDPSTQRFYFDGGF